MDEVGIDISSHRSKSVKDFLSMQIDLVITVCDHARQTCPIFPGGREVIHRSFEDPAGFSGSKEEKMALFREVSDEIRAWIEETFGGEPVS
jgi:arsenate reductase